MDNLYEFLVGIAFCIIGVGLVYWVSLIGFVLGLDIAIVLFGLLMVLDGYFGIPLVRDVISLFANLLHRK